MTARPIEAAPISLPLANAEQAVAWLHEHHIRRVELAFPDYTSVARGKLVATDLFTQSLGAKMAAVMLGFTVTGGEPKAVYEHVFSPTYPDMSLVPDWSTLVEDPLAGVPTATVICDGVAVFDAPDGGAPIDLSQLAPRSVLKAVIARLEQAGYRATVAPELEFFLVRTEGDEILPAHGITGRVPHEENSHDLASLDTAQTFAPFFDDLWAACEAQRIQIIGYGHESAVGQYEMNFAPGDPLSQADAVFRFKRLARELGRRHGFHATFLPKPFLPECGSGMHWHVSLADLDGRNAFSNADGSDHERLAHFIGGWQAAAAGTIAVLAPYAQSYVRLARPEASPVSADWGRDNRMVSFRVPPSNAKNRRVEHRLPGADSNPYLTMALMLGTGLVGIERKLAPGPEIVGMPSQASDRVLPRTPETALAAFEADPIVREVLGAPLVQLYSMIKHHELEEQRADPLFARKYLLSRA